ncbi:hypothetical protein ES703_56432 [subsurface metagenome]
MVHCYDEKGLTSGRENFVAKQCCIVYTDAYASPFWKGSSTDRRVVLRSDASGSYHMFSFARYA